mgnify:CR=1 FL=1
MEHELKILPPFFIELINGNKNFEIRKDDRDYKVGDTIILREFNDGTYTGRECSRKISFLLRGAEQYGLKNGFVILSIK